MNSITHTMVLNNVHEHEVVKGLKSLLPIKNQDCASLNAYAIRKTRYVVTSLPTKLWNKCIDSEIFPDCLKIAKVLPIHKTGSLKDPTNFRPISLIRTLSKVFEKLIKQRISNFPENFKLISTRQYGFRYKRSTIETLLVIEGTRTTIRNNEQTNCSAAFLDLREALDTVDHQILLGKLPWFVLSGHIFQLIKSYLTNRRQFTLCGTTESGIEKVEFGVPQGSILGPLFCTIHQRHRACL